MKISQKYLFFISDFFFLNFLAPKTTCRFPETTLKVSAENYMSFRVSAEKRHQKMTYHFSVLQKRHVVFSLNQLLQTRVNNMSFF